jgi:hypothetical protein
MSSTPSVLNSSGLSGGSATGLFQYGSGTNLLAAVQVGWYAQGTGSVNGLVSSVTDSGVSMLIVITAPAEFFTGNSYSFTSVEINTNAPCFKEGSKILCLKDEKEIYCLIEDLRKGDLIKTQSKGFIKLDMIGTSLFFNKSSNDRDENKLYKCPKEIYSELTEDLFITGSHSILVDTLTDEQQNKTKKSLGNLFITGNKWRLMAFIDLRTEPVKEEGVFRIYHLALESDNDVINYGIYANGLLVESCCKNYLKQHSNMTLLD